MPLVARLYRETLSDTAGPRTGLGRGAALGVLWQRRGPDILLYAQTITVGSGDDAVGLVPVMVGVRF